MNSLCHVIICTLSILLLNNVIAVPVVTVTHPIPVTVFYDPARQSVFPAGGNNGAVDGGSSSNNPGTGAAAGGSGNQPSNQQDGSGILEADEADGRVNARGTSTSTETRSSIIRAKFSTLPTDATTDVNSAFRMNTSFIFGTVAAVIMAAFIF